MALFNKESKEDRQAARLQAVIEKYGLENISDPVTASAVRDIARTMTTSSLASLGQALQFKAEESAKIDCLRAIIEQNFIIIRQLDKLSK